MENHKELEKLIEEKIKEKQNKDKDVFQLREQIKEELKQEIERTHVDKEKALLNKFKDAKVSRRNFLKTIGIGAGGLALSSTASAFMDPWRPKSQGLSDIDADMVDGKHASDFVASGDFAMESGSFWPGEGKNGVQSISFSNTYVSGAVIGTAAVNPSGRGGDVHDAAGAFNITTTGMDVHYSIDSSDPTNGSVKWTVMGIVDS